MQFYSNQIVFTKKVIAKKYIDAESLKFPDLPYDYNALEPVIDAETMRIHHTKHQKKYFDTMMEIIDKNDSIVDLMKNPSSIKQIDRQKFLNNAGGFYNHNLFWNVMSPKKKNISGEIKNLIEKEFKSLDQFKKSFIDTGMNHFGSGWIWLCINDGKLKLSSMINQNNPIIEKCGEPLLGCDLWEHAYYLKYQNDRNTYLEKWFELINWDYINEILEKTK